MSSPTLQQTLMDLESTLEDEREALRTLNGPKIDDTASRKAVLEQRLRTHAASGTPLAPQERQMLGRIRAAARQNLLLLVHARACVRGAIAAIQGCLDGAYPMAPAAAVAPLRVDVRR